MRAKLRYFSMLQSSGELLVVFLAGFEYQLAGSTDERTIHRESRVRHRTSVLRPEICHNPVIPGLAAR